MRPRPDPAATTIGLVFLLLAAVGLWAAFAPLDWPTLQGFLPFALVLVGLAGLAGTRSP